MPQLNAFWKLLQITLTKSYEPMLSKLIYLASPIFVMILKVISSLYEFLWDFRKYPGALFKCLKVAAGLVCE